MKDVKADRVKAVEYTDDTNLAVNALQFERKDGSKGTAYGPADNWLVNDLLDTRRRNHAASRPAPARRSGRSCSTCCRSC